MYATPVTHGPPDAAEVRRRACAAVFGQRLITNNFRAVIAETIIASALEPDWRWCAADWAGWDLEHRDGLRLEAKQSAARQTWQLSDGRPSTCSFDIKSRQGRYGGGTDWIAEERRNADLYAFAHHPVIDDSADHADPWQWHFYVVLERDLPPAKSIGLRKLKALAEPATYSNLKMIVDAAADRFRSSSNAVQQE